MTEVAAALAAMHLGPHHAVARVLRLSYRTRERREEARPAGAALELPIGHEQRLTACCTAERARPLFLEQRTRPRPLGVVFTQHRVLLRRQDATPLFVCFFDGKGHWSLVLGPWSLLLGSLRPSRTTRIREP